MSDKEFTHTNADVDVHAMGEVHEHPTWKEYKWVALILTLITVIEVWVYYLPFAKTPFFVPTLLVMSVVKFAIVVMFYMHLKYDHKLFRALFTGPLMIAMATLISLLFLFGNFPADSGRVVMFIAAALLHTGARISPTSFTVHPSTVVGILGLAALYEWGRGTRDGGRGKRLSSPLPHPPSPVPFYLALGVMFFSLNGWLHDLGDSYLFSAHMVQHLMLAFVVAPLMVMGTSAEMLRPLVTIRGVGPVARWITAPTHSFAIFSVVVAGWHLPPLYNYALAHHPIHIVQHLMFLAASVVMWWPVLSPMPELPRLSYPGQMLYLFLLSIPMAIVSVYISYADTVLYPMYASAPRIWGITPMNDQMIGGLIMWIPGGLFFYTIISIVFFRWQQRDGAESRAAAQVDWDVAVGRGP